MTIENFKSGIEQSPVPKNISAEFLNMNVNDFLSFLRSQRKEPALSIKIDWIDIQAARRLKAFLEDFDAISKGQKRFAVIRATEEQYKQELNVFASGVKWEKVNS